jgi:hypothetical protein
VADLPDEDDFTHYFNATARLSARVAALEEALRGLAEKWEERANEPVRFGYHEQHAADSAEASTYERCAEALRAALASSGTTGEGTER